MDLIELATIQLNKRVGGADWGCKVKDIRDWEANSSTNNGNATLTMSWGEKVDVNETVSAVQTAINDLWDQYANRANTSVAGADYTVTNLTTDRTYDANATTTDELADVLGTLITDLITAGVVQ